MCRHRVQLSPIARWVGGRARWQVGAGRGARLSPKWPRARTVPDHLDQRGCPFARPPPIVLAMYVRAYCAFLTTLNTPRTTRHPWSGHLLPSCVRRFASRGAPRSWWQDEGGNRALARRSSPRKGPATSLEVQASPSMPHMHYGGRREHASARNQPGSSCQARIIRLRAVRSRCRPLGQMLQGEGERRTRLWFALFRAAAGCRASVRCALRVRSCSPQKRDRPSSRRVRRSVPRAQRACVGPRKTGTNS